MWDRAMSSYWFICLNMLAVTRKIGHAWDCSWRQTEMFRTEASALAFLTGEPGELRLCFSATIPIYRILEVINYLHLMWLYSHGDTFYCGSFDIHFNVGLILGFSFLSIFIVWLFFSLKFRYHVISLCFVLAAYTTSNHI